MTGMYLSSVKFALGDPIAVTPKPWAAYYIDDWGTMGGRWGNWRLRKAISSVMFPCPVAYQSAAGLLFVAHSWNLRNNDRKSGHRAWFG
jgi:hypothetical protein